MPDYIVVRPAYGKELNSEKEVLSHYIEKKDFMILSLHHGAGQYLNRENCEKATKPITLQVRFGKKSHKVTLLDTTDISALEAKLLKLQNASKGGRKRNV